MRLGEEMRLSRVRENLTHGSLRGRRRRTSATACITWVNGPALVQGVAGLPTLMARLRPTRPPLTVS
jgi:hypothetical protein